MKDGDRIVREKEEEKITGLSRTTRWRLEREGKYPKSISLSSNSKGRLLSEIMAWLEERRKGGVDEAAQES